MIVGLDVTDKRNDLGQLTPMLDQHRERYGISPKIVIVDQGYQVEEEIIQLCSQESPTELYSTPPRPRTNVKPESIRKRRKISEKITKWRDKMKSEMAQQQ